MLYLKHLGAIRTIVSFIKQAGKLENGNGGLFQKSLMRTSAAVAQHPRHQHVTLDTETEIDR